MYCTMCQYVLAQIAGMINIYQYVSYMPYILIQTITDFTHQYIQYIPIQINTYDYIQIHRNTYNTYHLFNTYQYKQIQTTIHTNTNHET